MKKNKGAILLEIFNGSKLLLLISISVEVLVCILVFFWFKNIGLLGVTLGKGNIPGSLIILGKIACFVLPPQIIRYFIQMPALNKIYQNINRKSKNIAYEHFSKINLNSLDESTYLRVNILGEYINTTIFNMLTLTRDRIQFFLITIISLLLYKPKMGILYSIYVFLYILWIKKHIRGLFKGSEEVSATRNDSKEFISDLNRNFFLHKLFQLHDLNKTYLDKFVNKENKALEENQNYLKSYFALASTSNMISMLLLIFFVIKSTLPIEIKAVLAITVANSIKDLNGLILYFPMLFGEFGRIGDALKIFDYPLEHKKIPLNEKKIESIKLNNISYSYKYKNENGIIISKPVINNFSYEFKKGLNIISGDSGKGKSTLLKLTIGLIPTNQGEILINDIHLLKDYNILDKVSYVTQSEFIFNRTVKENLLLNNQENEKYKNYIKEVKIENLVNKNVGINGELISGGECKRISIGRMLIKDEPGNLLIFDEPFYGLDNGLVNEIIKIITSYKDNIILIVDHTKCLENYLNENNISFNLLKM